VPELFSGVIGGLIFGLIFGQILEQSLKDFPDVIGLNYLLQESGGMIFALFFGLVFGAGSGLGSFEIEQRTIPNQGIRSSQKNCLIFGLIFGVFIGLISGQVGVYQNSGSLISWQIFGLGGGVIVGLKYGGAACIKHFTLRQMLHKKGRIPWNYAKFLDFASERLLMKKIGGGYVFFHRMLLEHFARMKTN
jgi:hypothetical protein